MIKKIKSKEYALGVERMDKGVGAPTNDLLVAGCHRIAYNEMESIAKQLGWD